MQDETIKSLLQKAREEKQPDAAMKFTQAALNAANAIAQAKLVDAEYELADTKPVSDG